MLPSFVIIGAMKAGTTSLHAYLKTSRTIAAPTRKETDFFLSPDVTPAGLDRYRAFFDTDKACCFEASPNYSKRHLFPGVPERMHAVMPETKLIYVLRDPISRIVSHYVHSYAKRVETRSFAEAIRVPGNNYVLTSRYHHQIEAFLDHYPIAQIKIVDFEDLKAKPKAAVEAVFAFLGRSGDIDWDGVGRRVHDSDTKRRATRLEFWLHRLNAGRSLRVQAKTERWLSAYRAPFARPVVRAEDHAYLVDALGDDVAQLRSLTGLAFESWSL